jgi:hypothetical protein
MKGLLISAAWSTTSTRNWLWDSEDSPLRCGGASQGGPWEGAQLRVLGCQLSSKQAESNGSLRSRHFKLLQNGHL